MNLKWNEMKMVNYVRACHIWSNFDFLIRHHEEDESKHQMQNLYRCKMISRPATLFKRQTRNDKGVGFPNTSLNVISFSPPKSRNANAMQTSATRESDVICASTERVSVAHVKNLICNRTFCISLKIVFLFVPLSSHCLKFCHLVSPSKNLWGYYGGIL